MKAKTDTRLFDAYVNSAATKIKKDCLLSILKPKNLFHFSIKYVGNEFPQPTIKYIGNANVNSFLSNQHADGYFLYKILLLKYKLKHNNSIHKIL